MLEWLPPCQITSEATAWTMYLSLLYNLLQHCSSHTTKLQHSKLNLMHSLVHLLQGCQPGQTRRNAAAHLPSSLKFANCMSSTSRRLPCFFTSSCVALLRSPSTAMIVKLTPGLVFFREQLSSCCTAHNPDHEEQCQLLLV